MNFFGWLLAIITWIVGLGSPTQHTIDVVAVYYPAVLGALTVIPVYFIGKELFGRWAGVLSAGLLAVLPGEFLGRSILGATDHHVAETLFSAVTLMFLILAVKVASQRRLTFGHLKRRDWATIGKPIIYSLLAGIFLGVYIFTWLGALLFVFIISAYFIIQFVVDHLKHKSTDYLCFVGVTLFLVTIIISLAISVDALYLVSLIIALFIPLVLNGVSRLMTGRQIEPAYYPLALLVLGAAGFGLFHLVSAPLFNAMLNAFSIFNPKGAQLTTIEMQRLLFPQGEFTLDIAWGNFTTGFFLSFVSLAILVYLVIKQGEAEKTILFIWSLVILAATLGQRRFGYYYAVNVALLTGYFSVLIYFAVQLLVDYFRGASISYSWQQLLESAGFKERLVSQVEISPKLDYYQVLGVSRNATHKQIRRAFRELVAKYHSDRNYSDKADNRFRLISKAYEVLSNPGKRAAYDRSEYTLATKAGRRTMPKKGGRPIAVSYVVMALAVPVIFFVVFFGNIKPAIAVAGAVQYAPSDAWVSSLTWMRGNTPEPFDNPDFYYALPKQPPPGERYKYPKSAYGVLAWWDYGYWITRIAHRIPNANPSQDPASLTTVASFFIAQDEKSANEIAQKLRSTYIIIDNQTAYVDPITGSGKFWAVATWAGRQPSEYFDFYLIPQQNNTWVLRPFFYPEYYRSLVVRLYNFDGQAVTPESVWVISYEERRDKAGNIYKVITGAEEKGTYEEAEAYVSSQESGNYRIANMNPMLSPVPLEAVEHYKLVHSSDNLTLPDGRSVPEIKIFEYID